MIEGLKIPCRGDMKACIKPACSAEKPSNAKDKGFARILEENVVSDGRSGSGDRQLRLADEKAVLASQDETIEAEEVISLSGTEADFLWKQIIDSILNQQLLAIPQDILARIETYVTEKMPAFTAVSEEENLSLRELAVRLESQLAAMAEEAVLDAKTAAQLKDAVLEKVQDLLNGQEKNDKVLPSKLELLEDKPGLLADSRDMKTADEKNIQEKTVILFPDKESSPKKDVRELIQFEQMKMAGKKMEKDDKSQIKLDESLTDKKDIPFASENNRPMLDAKRTVFLLNTQKQVPVNPKEVVDQIVKKAELLVKQGLSEMKIELKPEFLGKMTIKIVVEEGAVTAKFLAENLRVKQMLESNMANLKQSLENQGLKVEKTEVNVQLNNGGMFDGSENSRQFLWQKPEFSAAVVRRDLADTGQVLSGNENAYIPGEKEVYEKGILGSTISWLI